MGQINSALGHHLHQISETELKPEIPPDAEDDDLSVEMAAFEKILNVQHSGSRPPKECSRQVCRPFAVCTRTNRNASHPVNAILNYAYTVLQSEIQINAITEGYDPTIGIVHEARDGSSAFIFDLMEPERPVTDRKVLEFIKGNIFDPTDFVIRTDGVCRLKSGNGEVRCGRCRWLMIPL